MKVTNSARIEEICAEHLYEGDLGFSLTLQAIAKGLAQPTPAMAISGIPWMEELAALCKDRSPRVILTGWDISIRD